MKYIANIFSYLFHPLLSVTYILLLIMKVDPFIFGSYSIGGSLGILAMVFFSTFVIPVFAVFLMYKLDFLSDITMPNHKDRLVPLIISMVCYFSVFAFIYQQIESPVIFQIAMLGACIGMAISFVISVFYKLSLHSVGMGAILAIALYLCVQYRNIDIIFDLGFLGYYSVHIMILLLCIIILCGIVMTSRLYLKTHSSNQVFGGFIIGMLVEYSAFFIYNQFL